MRLGRNPPVYSRHSMRAAIALHAALNPLGPPPSVSSDYVTAVERGAGPEGWRTYLNDQLGDCVIADSAHQVMLHSANGGSIVIPTDQDVLRMYEKVGGYVPGNPSTDQGCVEADACRYLETTGLAGVKSAGSGPIDPARLDHIRWAIQIFGACRLGITITQQMMDAFSAGQAWETLSGNALGGHDVPAVRYDTEHVWVVTWGRLQPIAWSLMGENDFLEEAHCELWPDFVSAGGTAPNGFDLAGMLAQLPRVEAAA